MAKVHEVNTILQKSDTQQQNATVQLSSVLHKSSKYKSFCILVHKVPESNSVAAGITQSAYC